MKHLHGTAEATVDVPVEDCVAFLAALDAYPTWYPEVVREVDVVEWGEDGLPARAETKLRVSWATVSRDVDLLLAVRVPSPDLVQLTYVPRGTSSDASFDAVWRIEDGASTHLQLELDATMPVPGLVPLGGADDAFASGFVEAAVRGLESRS